METPTGTPSGARAAEDVGPYHAHMVPARTTHPMVGRDVPGAPRTRGRPRGRHQPRGPPGTSAPTTRTWCRPVVRTHGRARRPRRAAHMETPTGTPSGARAAEDVGPYHAHMVPARTTHPMVGRDVPGAPRTRGRHGDAIRHAGRRGRRPLPRAHGVGPYHARTHLHTGWGPVSASRAEGGAGTSRASPSATGCRNPKVSRRRRKRSQTSRSQNEKSDIIAP